MFRVVVIITTLLVFLQPSYAFISAKYSTEDSLASTIQKRLVSYVHKTVNTLRYSAYKMGGSRFDTKKGVYIVDCSNYVDQILQAVSPQAYLSLVNSTGAETPTTRHYFDFFSDLGGADPHWDKIDDMENLRAGDIIVFRYKKKPRGITRGHVMVVMDKPMRDGNVFLVRVADSAPTGHSNDTRRAHTSGIGIGTLLLKANPRTGQPAAYAWRNGALWKRNVSFAMARPIESKTSDQHKTS